MAGRAGNVTDHRGWRLVRSRATILLPIVPATVAVVRSAVETIAAITSRHTCAKRLTMRLRDAILIWSAVGVGAGVNRKHAIVAREHVIGRANTLGNAADDLTVATRTAVLTSATLVDHTRQTKRMKTRLAGACRDAACQGAGAMTAAIDAGTRIHSGAAARRHPAVSSGDAATR